MVAARQTIAGFRTGDGSEPLTGFAAPKPTVKAGGKSELHRAVRRVIPGQGNLTDSGTENIPPTGVAKRRGKGEKVR